MKKYPFRCLFALRFSRLIVVASILISSTVFGMEFPAQYVEYSGNVHNGKWSGWANVTKGRCPNAQVRLKVDGAMITGKFENRKFTSDIYGSIFQDNSMALVLHPGKGGGPSTVAFGKIREKKAELIDIKGIYHTKYLGSKGCNFKIKLEHKD